MVWLIIGAVFAALVVSVVTMQAWNADAAPGDDDATFVAIDPCRAEDTRTADVGTRSTPLGEGETHFQSVTGPVGNCNIPADATAVAMNVTVANGTAASFLAVFPENQNDLPLVSSSNWGPGDSPFPNKVDVLLSPDGKIKLYNAFGTVDVILDFVGYYTPNSLLELQSAVEASKTYTLHDDINQFDQTILANAKDTEKSLAQISDTAAIDGMYSVSWTASMFSDTALNVDCDVLAGDASLPITGLSHGAALPVNEKVNISGTAAISATAGQVKDLKLVCRPSADGSIFVTEADLVATLNPTK